MKQEVQNAGRISLASRHNAINVLLMSLLSSTVSPALMAAGSGGDAGRSGVGNPPITLDQFGILQSSSTNRFGTGTTNGFFANLGTNGRTCGTCHVQEDAWTFTPSHARQLAHDDPLFAPVDGADCPPEVTTQRPNNRNSSMVLNYGLIRIELAIPAGADYALTSTTNPKGCAIPPGSPANQDNLFLFRRPLPSTNLLLLSAVMWDGRETLDKITTQIGETNTSTLLFDLADQANSATTGHAQGSSIVGTRDQSDIVAFEDSLSTAQAVYLQPTGLALLTFGGANGGSDYLQNTVTPAFYIGINDPLNPPFTTTVFTLYATWEPGSPGYARLGPAQKAIGRGEAIFNNTKFVVHDVPGINSVPSDPLYNPADPLAGQDITTGCALCHNSPNVGNHSTSLPINIGTTAAHPVNNDGSPNTALDIANLPVYTLTNLTSGSTIRSTDPGKAMISGKWVDLGKTKGPILRGLAARAPYFHNGSAKDLAAVVTFYNQRFQIGLTPQQQSDLAAFLEAL